VCHVCFSARCANLAEKHKIAGYFRYVDDILLIYDSDHTNIQDIANDFNSLHPNLKFTTETETNNKLNYLDITVHRTHTGWKTSIYRKPNFTDSIIPYSSNHPAQHKYAAIRYLYNRLNTHNLHDNAYRTEENTIHSIMFNNAFSIPPKNPPHQKKITTTLNKPTTTAQKWATFTYVGKQTTFITSLFKHTDLKIALRSNNSIQDILMHNKQLPNKADKYTQSRVYKLTCPDCNKVYVRQTGINFLTRFKEHKAAFRTNSQSSNFAKHLIEPHNLLAPSKILILQCQNKGAYLNTIERYYIYAEFTKNNHLNDEHTIFPNKIFEALLMPDQP